MDYEKAYKEALERAREYYDVDDDNTLSVRARGIMEHLFPELKESEDERIRNGLLRHFKNKTKPYWNEIAVKDIIAYLEKQKEQKPAEWGEEDEKNLKLAYDLLVNGVEADRRYPELISWLKSLRPQPKEEREPMEIKYGGKIYQVHGMRALPGGAYGYIIEDEPGHYDCIMNPEEVLGGGYGVKQNGSPYPTKEATFDEPHWKPSEEQMLALGGVLDYLEESDNEDADIVRELINDLKKL